jgi:hypothetical protein
LLRYNFRLATVLDGYPVQTMTTTSGSDKVTFFDNQSGGAAVDAVVYRAGAFDATRLKTGKRITVDGKTGYYGSTRARVISNDGVESTALAPSVGWQYAKNSWIVVSGVQSKYQTRSIELAVARTIQPASGAEVHVPFTSGTCPTRSSPPPSARARPSIRP